MLEGTSSQTEQERNQGKNDDRISFFIPIIESRLQFFQNNMTCYFWKYLHIQQRLITLLKPHEVI